MTAMMVETVHTPYDPKPIITARLSKGWTQKEAALRAEIHVGTYTRIEAGDKISSDSLKRVCLALEIPVPVVRPMTEQKRDRSLYKDNDKASGMTREKTVLRQRRPSSRHLDASMIHTGSKC